MNRQYEAMLAMSQGAAIEDEYEPVPELDEYELLKRQYEGKVAVVVTLAYFFFRTHTPSSSASARG